jgi:hypothetical protein
MNKTDLGECGVIRDKQDPSIPVELLFFPFTKLTGSSYLTWRVDTP